MLPFVVPPHNAVISILTEALREKEVYLYGPLEKPPNNLPHPIVSANLYWLWECDICYTSNIPGVVYDLSKLPAPNLRFILTSFHRNEAAIKKLWQTGKIYTHVDRSTIPINKHYTPTTGIIAAAHLLTLPINKLHVMGMDLYGGNKTNSGPHKLKPQAHNWNDLIQTYSKKLHLCHTLLNSIKKLTHQ